MKLEPSRVTQTAEELHRRMQERFPDRGLVLLARDLTRQADLASQNARDLGEPIRSVRLAIAGLVILLIALVGATLYTVHMPDKLPDLIDLVGFLEASVNNLVFVGLAVVFLLSLEARIKRHRVLQVIHSLRSLAHIIDMHQLTKDPYRLDRDLPQTASSPRPDLDAFLLRRYLDYCCEMLSITGKIAAIYAQYFDDEVVLNAVNEVEDLTTGLSRKIWQKVMILDQNTDRG